MTHLKRRSKGVPVFEQANREALFSVILALMYMAWWYYSAYGLSESKVQDYSYILGFPAWFFLSCIAGYAVFSALAFLMVSFLFRDIPLDEVKSPSGKYKRS